MVHRFRGPPNAVVRVVVTAADRRRGGDRLCPSPLHATRGPEACQGGLNFLGVVAGPGGGQPGAGVAPSSVNRCTIDPELEPRPGRRKRRRSSGEHCPSVDVEEVAKQAVLVARDHLADGLRVAGRRRGAAGQGVHGVPQSLEQKRTVSPSSAPGGIEAGPLHTCDNDESGVLRPVCFQRKHRPPSWGFL